MDLEDRPYSALSDRYTLVREIGRGGMATVFLAEDIKLKRQVAVKTLLPDLSGAVAGDRFLQEIEISARFNHPNIVKLYDAGESDGTLYYVMPFEDGESLRAYIDRAGPLPLEEALRIAREVAEALAHAHHLGVVHRDIKPENILLSQGHAIVADFGIARALEKASRHPLTGIGLAVGTPSYMSPEQAEGREQLDGRSDLYSLGCVLYEMLGGEPPFPGRTPQAVSAHRLRGPLPIDVLRPGLPKGIERLLRKALQVIPADRFQTAEEFQKALRAPGLLPNEVPSERSPAWLRAGRLVAGLALAVVGALVIREVISPDGPGLDPERVMVFPLGDRGGAGLDGADAALSIVMALEHADPIRPLDGWDQLSAAERADLDLLDSGRAREIALAAGAGHYIMGAVTRRGDSVGVSLTLFSTEPDSVAGRESASGLLPGDLSGESGVDQVLSQVGIRTALGVLPALIDPGRAIELPTLVERDPAAVVQWMYGEREYRLSRFEEALGFYESAVEGDSLLVFAALKGAQAASWIKDSSRAMRLAEVAVRNADILPDRHRDLAWGLYYFQAARPDSAAHFLRFALEADPEWSEAWMALGEVYHHLFPSDLVVDSVDLDAFRRSAELDAGFHPPLIHLAEYAIRVGRVEEARAYIQRLSTPGTLSRSVEKLSLMVECVEGGMDEADWAAAVAEDPMTVLDAGRLLAAGGNQTACAESALRAVMRYPGIEPNLEWGAMQGLQGVLMAEGRFGGALAVLDSAQARGYGEGQYYLLVDVIAGAPWQERARDIESMVRARYPGGYGGLRIPALWLMGNWYANAGDAGMLAVAQAAVGERAGAGDTDAAAVLPVLEGQRLLLEGDTAGAVQMLESVMPRSSATDIGWRVHGALPIRHLTLARLFLDQGRYQEALRVASFFDHPEPVVFLPFVPESLRIRMQAAQALRLSAAAENYRSRLQKLGHSAVVSSP